MRLALAGTFHAGEIDRLLRDETRPSRVAPFRQDQIDRVTGRVLGQPAADQHLELLILLAAYLKGDLVTASQYTNLDTSETHPLNLLARARRSRAQRRSAAGEVDNGSPQFALPNVVRQATARVA